MWDKKIYILGLLFVFVSIGSLLAQDGFDCNGRVFRVLEKDGGSYFEEVSLGTNPMALEHKALAFFPDMRLNSICYRPSDNLVYGLEIQQPYQLIRINARYELETLKTLALPEHMTFVSGDISPDGRFLVLLGYSEGEMLNVLAKIDLSDPNYPISLTPLVTTGIESKVFCADIAFHPTTGILFGFDHMSARMITIDMHNRLIDNHSYPVSTILKGNMPSLFFNNRGQLFGIASPNDRFNLRNLYQLHPDDGRIEMAQELEVERNQDACSCPYSVNLYNRVSARNGFPCTELVFTLAIVNKTPYVQENVQLRDTFGGDLIIKEILKNPFPGTVVSGVGTNILAINKMNIEIGIDSIQVLLSIPEGQASRVFKNQAYLHNINSFLENGAEQSVSDDPQTAKPNDPTVFAIQDLEVLFDDDFPMLCPGETMTLTPQVNGALNYRWNTGAQDKSITVAEEGWYELEIETYCGTTSGGVYVEKDDLAIDIGENFEVELGDRITLSPAIRSFSDIKAFFWKRPAQVEEVLCYTCSEMELDILSEEKILLEVQNENGCLARDEILISPMAFKYYAPTAFSPDGNGQNDNFFLNGALDFTILDFQIYNKWGALIFRTKDIQANRAELGWDGTSKNQALDPGAYLWVAEVKNGLGKPHVIKGEVTLIR